MIETYIFIYHSSPGIHRAKSCTRRFRNQSEADSFADGLRRGGAMDVHYVVTERGGQKGKRK